MESPKVQALLMRGDAMDVDVPALGFYLTHRNSPIIGALRSSTLHRWLAFIASAFVALYWLTTSVGLSRRVVIVVTLGLLFSFQTVYAPIFRDAIAFSVKKSYAIARRRVEESRPDIVVGFSFGGCLATMLLRDKVGRHGHDVLCWRVCCSRWAGGEIAPSSCAVWLTES